MTFKELCLDWINKKEISKLAALNAALAEKKLREEVEAKELTGPFVVDNYIITIYNGQVQFQTIESIPED